MVSCHNEVAVDDEDVVREKRGELMRMDADCGYPEDRKGDAVEDAAGLSAGCDDCGVCSCCCMNLAEKRCEASRSSVVILSFGSLRNKELMTTRASGEIELGIWNRPLRILPNK